MKTTESLQFKMKDAKMVFFSSTCGEDDKAAQMPAEDSERSGFPAWIDSGSAVCPCPLGIGWEMLDGSRDPNMLFHSSFTFESCFTCFLAISSWGMREGRERINAMMTTFI